MTPSPSTNPSRVRKQALTERREPPPLPRGRGSENFASPGKPAAAPGLSRVLPVVLAVALVFLAAAGRAPAQSVWELTPYRIQLITALSPTATLNPALAAELSEGIMNRVDTVIGVRWEVVPVEPSPRLRHRMLDELASVQFEDLPEDAGKCDKVFLVAVVPSASGYEVVAREVDVRTHVFSPIVKRLVWQTAKLRDTVFEAMLDVFTPLAQVAKTARNEVTLRLRAGGLPIRDPSVVDVRPGDVFQPIMRYSDRQGEFRKAMVVPWTFLLVDQCDAEGFRATLHSAMLSPMSGRRRGRVEALALAVRPSGESTRVVLRGRVEPKPLLAGYQIYDQKIGSKKTKLVGRTDADGRIDIGPGEHAMRLLVVKSGKVLLARLPVVPGLVPEMTAEIRNDDQRLEAEGFITAMQLNLIDLVTRQKILIRRARDDIESGDLESAAKVVEELQTMPTEETLMRELNNQQERIVVEDKWTRKKVDELFDETRKLLKKHLVSEPIKELARDVAAAQRQPRDATTSAE
ncbi:MAG: hypothetical protein JW719_11285 [Pirellulales bacterium]|nr:hypothetical protein [Pirellulales bacterium]